MNSDYSNIQRLFKIGKIIGITSSWTGQVTVYRKFYCLILIGLSVVGTILSLLNRYSALHDLNMNPAQVFLESLECISELFFMVACLLGVFLRENNWKKYCFSISKMEEEMRLFQFEVRENVGHYILKILAFHIGFLAIHTYETLTWIEVEGLNLQGGYVLSKIVMYYQFFSAFLIIHTTQFLKARYNFINKLIEGTLEGKTRMIVISAKDDRRIIIKFAKIQKLYHMLHNVVNQINVIYGWTLFFYFTTYILSILDNVNYGLKYANEDDAYLNKTIAVNYIVYTGFYTVSTIAIVMSCDGVEQSGKKIVKTCFLYREILERPSLKDELLLFAKFAKILAPKFSAAGFFNINQSLLSTLFSAVTTYLIIIIQFNMTL